MAGVADAREELVQWCRNDLEPHVEAEAQQLRPAAAAHVETRLLARALADQHRVLLGLVGRVAETSDTTEAVGAAVALRVVLDGYTAKVHLILPVLAADAHVSLAELLHEVQVATAVVEKPPPGEERSVTESESSGHSCGCHEAEAAGHPELDARVVPHAVRHATIFGALDAIAVGSGLILVAPHDPLPLLAQLEDRAPAAFTIEYLERGPEAWRLLLVRQSA